MFCIPRHADYFKRPRIFVTNHFLALNLPIISQSVCQCLKIMLQPKIDEHTRTAQARSFSPIYPQTLGSGERSCKLQTLQLITRKFFALIYGFFARSISHRLHARSRCYKTFFSVFDGEDKKLVRFSLPSKIFSSQSNI